MEEIDRQREEGEGNIFEEDHDVVFSQDDS